MDREIKLEAAALEFALHWDFIDLADVVGWADKQIESAIIPDEEIICLSLAKSKIEASILLKHISGFIDEWRVIKRFLCRFKNLDSLDPNLASEISGTIYRRLPLSSAGPAQNEFHNFWSFWIDLDLAIDGITGDPIKISAEILEDIKRLAL